MKGPRILIKYLIERWYKRKTANEKARMLINEAINSGSKSLDLANLGLTRIPTEFKQLKNLERLSLRSNKLKSLPSCICKLSSLKWIELSCNYLRSLPSAIGKLENIETLSVDNNRLKTLPKEMGQLPRFSGLRIFNNRLRMLPANIGDLINLTKINLASNKLTKLPLQIGFLKNLKELNLFDNLLVTLPAEIGNLVSLEELQISRNRIRTLPLEIGLLKNLCKLDARDNRLETLPPSIGDLSSLNILDLCSNKLWKLPPQIGKLGNLIRLDISMNNLTEIPSEIGQLSELQSLHASHNMVSVVPTEFARLCNLKVTTLDKNHLSSLPPEIGQLTNLEQLFLSDNQLVQLPNGIGKLLKLKYLDIDNNKLINIPSELGNLTQLCELSLNDNMLRELPPELCRLLSSTELYLKNNPFEGPFQKLLDRYMDEPLRYLSDIGAQRMRGPQLGDVVEKTFLVNRLLGSGAAGDVYQVELTQEWQDLDIGEELALKWYSPRIEGREAREIIELRRQRELEVGLSIKHKNLIHIYDTREFMQDNRLRFIVMEYVDGRRLSEVKPPFSTYNSFDSFDFLDLPWPGWPGGLSTELVFEIMKQLTEGILALHNAGIVHRDIKPDNIILENHTSRVKLLDLGVARPMKAKTITASQAFLGSLVYSAPEWVLGEECTKKSDVYSVGAVLFRLLEGRDPFSDINPWTRKIEAIESKDLKFHRASQFDNPLFTCAVKAGIEMLQKVPSNRPSLAQIHEFFSLKEKSRLWREKWGRCVRKRGRCVRMF